MINVEDGKRKIIIVRNIHDGTCSAARSFLSSRSIRSYYIALDVFWSLHLIDLN